MVDLISASEKENELIVKASKELGNSYLISVELFELLQCIKNVGVFIFPHFLGQITSDIHLAILSCIRRHSVQWSCMLRHALETLPLAIYSLHNVDPKTYGSFSDDGEVIENYSKESKSKAYEFLLNNFVEYSVEIKKKKEYLNDVLVHANISSAKSAINFEETKMIVSIFDNYTDFTIKLMLLETCEIIILILDFIVKAREKYNHFDFKDGFEFKFLTTKDKLSDISYELFDSEEYMKIQERADKLKD